MRHTLQKDELVHGAHYKGRCRNAEVARWDATRGKFVHRQYECGFLTTEEICHPADEHRYDVFIPEVRIMVPVDEVIPFYVPYVE